MSGDVLNRIVSAADKVARLEPKLEEARQERQEAIREAYADGIPVVVIARLSGLTRQRVTQLVRSSP